MKGFGLFFTVFPRMRNKALFKENECIEIISKPLYENSY